MIRLEETGKRRGGGFNGGFGIDKWQCYVGDGAGREVGGGKQVAKGEWRWICSWYVCQDVGELEGDGFWSSSKWVFFVVHPHDYKSTERDSVDRRNMHLMWGSKTTEHDRFIAERFMPSVEHLSFFFCMLISRFRYWFLFGQGTL
jgi:hypothetical protein